MRILICFAVVWVIAVNAIFAQSISGRIVHKQNAVEFATVRVLAFEDSLKTILATITDTTGRFEFTNLSFRKYFLKISCVGYSSQSISVLLDSIHPNIHLDSLELVAETNTLGAVTITAQRQSLKKTQSGFIIAAKDNISQAAGTLTDLLRSTPTVVVDEEGSISIRGKSPLILINGRNSALSSTDRIPASSVESIEIINNPSAKYDADAEGGIINITLKKNRSQGTNGSLALGGGMGAKSRVNSAFIINHQQGKWNLGLSYDNRFANRTRKANAERINFNLQDEHDLQQNRHDERFEQTQNLKFNADFSPNKQNSFGLELIGNIDGEDNHETLRSLMNSQDKTFNFDNSRHSEEFVREKAVEAALLYVHKYNTAGKTLSVNLSTSFNFDRENTGLTTQAFDSAGKYSGTPFLQQTHNYQNSNVSTLKLDYAQPLSKNASYETGYKAIVRSTDADFRTANLLNNQYVTDPRASNLFHFNEQIHAAYFLYKNAIGSADSARLKYELGLRLEEALNSGQTGAGNIAFNNQYLNYFPSANVAYYFKPNESLRISYSRRINRPGLGQLNPFVDITDSLNPHGGNPYLKPELSNSFEFGFNRDWQMISTASTVFYRYSTNIIRPFISLDANGVALVVPKNYGNATTYGVEEIVSAHLGKKYTSNLSVSLFQQHINGSNVSSDALSDYFSWYAKMSNNFTVWKGGKIQLILNYNSPIAMPQGTRIAVYNLDGGFQQKLFNGRGAFGLVVSDIFNTQKNGFTALTKDFSYHRTFKVDTRAVLLTFTWSFRTAVKDELLENRYSND